jgi:hypothetical protein
MLGTRKRREPVIGTTSPTRKRGGLFGRPTRKEKVKQVMSGEPVKRQRRQGFLARLTGPRRSTRTRAVPVTHHQRHPTIGDKISGFGKRVMGSFTRRPGKKAAGTRQMRGTDGRGAKIRRRFF